MPKYLLIVESPTKKKTLGKFLGSEFTFESSVGHIRDLPEKRFGITIDDKVHCDYEVLPSKKEVVKNLIKAAKKADIVYLCPDPDREGEAIAWHIRQLLPKEIKTRRVSFNSITASAVREAIASPREIDLSLVDAQQARRVLDRLVGYSVSPILAQRVQMGRRAPSQGSLSAGRVQSVALKLVVDREKEIEGFKPQEYWNLSVDLSGSVNSSFTAHLLSVDGKRVEKIAKDDSSCQIDNASKAQIVSQRLEKANYKILGIERKEKRRFPVAPFTTSTLQQEASRHFGFSAQRTMSVAQELYEGIDLGSEGPEGLITYMRTDSVRLAPEAENGVRQYIIDTYTKQYLEPSVRKFTSQKSAQEAHEAIRPTNLQHPPESVERYLSSDQFKLYSLIWKRTIATQMKPAVYDTVQVDIEAAPGLLVRANGSQMKFKGFLSVYEEKFDEEQSDETKLLPNLQEGEVLNLIKVHSSQSFTQPPARYSEASLVKALEQSGIGRPSTYAAIMNKIQSREYTVKEKGRLKPTELGKVTIALLESSFASIMNLQFTAMMEDELEQIACGKRDWQNVVIGFWKEFSPSLDEAKKSAHVPKVDTDKLCPKCGKHLQKIWAGRDYFYGCSAYPECDYRVSSQQLDFDPKNYNPDFDWDQKCPKCGGEMTVRFGPYGVFLGCKAYPQCRGLINAPKAGETALGPTDTPCPATGCDGHLVTRKSRFGKIFYSCSNYPDCNVIGNTLEDTVEKFQGQPKTPYVKASNRYSKAKKSEGKAPAKKSTAKKSSAKKVTSKKRENSNSPFSKPITLTPKLKALTGLEETSRGDLTKKLWDYIKSKNLQDPNDKRYILCDRVLKDILGEDRLHMTALPGKLAAHLKEGF